jgi:meckelin
MYKENEAACIPFRASGTAENTFYNTGWISNYPWIYYQGNAKDYLENGDRVKRKFKFQSTDSKMRFVLGQYSLEGDFLGFRDLTTELQLCPTDYEYGQDYREFGKSVKSKCEISVSKLINSNLQPNNTDVFYDLWYVDSNGDYLDVPVKINNYIDSSGGRPNESSDKKNWKLTRRFFIYDTQSGLEGTDAYKNGGSYGEFIRWLSKVNIIVELDTGGNDSVFIPYVELEYNSKAKNVISSDSSTDIEFEAKYTMDPGNFWLVAYIFFGIINGIVILMTIWKVYVWTRRHPSPLMGSVYSIKLILNSIFIFIESWSIMMFWFLFFLSFSFYASFKLSEAPSLLMPQDEDNNLTPFAVIFGFVCGLKLIVIGVKVFRQTTCSYYVLDREKNMANVYSTLTNMLQKNNSNNRDFYERQVKEEEEPKAWRPIFVMNEMNELQTFKVIHVEILLIWTLFLMSGEGWEFASQYQPEVDFGDTRSPESYVLMFFLFTIVIMVVGTTFYIIRYLVSFLLPLRYVTFTDLCSVANVSIFIFDEKFHGYYIHGESPSTSSDITLSDLKLSLDREGQGNALPRGLVDFHPTLQTYEFYLPYSERKLFDEVFEENKEALRKKKGDEEVYLKKTPKKDFIYKSNDVGLYEEDFRKIITKKDEMDYYLVSKIQDIRRNPKEYIADVTFLYNLTRMPPESILDLAHIKLVADRFMNFTRVLLSELDFDIMWLMACFYTAFDAIGLKVIHSTLIFYIFYKFLIRYPRHEIGESKLSRTSGIDSRFLI